MIKITRSAYRCVGRTRFYPYGPRNTFAQARNNQDHGSLEALKDLARRLTGEPDEMKRDETLKEKIENVVEKEESTIEKLKDVAKKVTDAIKAEPRSEEQKPIDETVRHIEAEVVEKVEHAFDKLKDVAKTLTETMATEKAQLDEQAPIPEPVKEDPEKPVTPIDLLKDVTKKVAETILPETDASEKLAKKGIEEEVAKATQDPNAMSVPIWSLFKSKEDEKASAGLLSAFLMGRAKHHQVTLKEKLFGQNPKWSVSSLKTLMNGKKDNSWLFGSGGLLNFRNNDSIIKKYKDKLTAPQRKAKFMIKFGLVGLFIYGLATSLPGAYLTYVLEKEKLEMERRRMRLQELRP